MLFEFKLMFPLCESWVLAVALVAKGGVGVGVIAKHTEGCPVQVYPVRV
jgi:hypothetical protein